MGEGEVCVGRGFPFLLEPLSAVVVMGNAFTNWFGLWSWDEMAGNVGYVSVLPMRMCKRSLTPHTCPELLSAQDLEIPQRREFWWAPTASLSDRCYCYAYGPKNIRVCHQWFPP